MTRGRQSLQRKQKVEFGVWHDLRMTVGEEAMIL
jgi:hypothetical protein